jgi:AcrR family transcriptional regulator
MYETFEKLPESRREQILQVCIEEFVQKGYRNASTNTMVKRLGISKGVLFLYFKSKKNLYLYIVEYLTKILVDDFFAVYPLTDSCVSIDVFDNLGEYYIRLIQVRPDYFLFLLDAFMNPVDELKQEIEERHNIAHDTLLENLSTVGFREGIDLQVLVNLLHMVSYFLGQSILKNYDFKQDWQEDIKKDIDQYAKLYGEYVDILKYGVFERKE